MPSERNPQWGLGQIGVVAVALAVAVLVLEIRVSNGLSFIPSLWRTIVMSAFVSGPVSGSW